MLVKLIQEYPSVIKDNITTKVSVNISVIHIDKLDETEMLFSVKILIQLMWYDSRLTFYNIKNYNGSGNNVGKEEREGLWIPQLIFSNSLPEIYIKNDEDSYLMVRQESLSRLNGNNNLQENELFDGTQNPFIFEHFFDLKLRCNFEFSNYPFDEQICYILVSHFLLFVYYKS